MESSSTVVIVQSLAGATLEHRVSSGIKLTEQKLANFFGVSRSLVCQALLPLSQHHLLTLERPHTMQTPQPC